MTASEYSEAVEEGRRLANALLRCAGPGERAIHLGAAVAKALPRGRAYVETMRDLAISLYEGASKSSPNTGK